MSEYQNSCPDIDSYDNDPDRIKKSFQVGCGIDNIDPNNPLVNKFIALDNYDKCIRDHNKIGINLFPYNKCSDSGIVNSQQSGFCRDPSSSMKAAYVCGNLEYLNKCTPDFFSNDFLSAYGSDVKEISTNGALNCPSPNLPAPQPTKVVPQPNDDSDCSNCPCPKETCSSCQPDKLCTRDVCNNLIKFGGDDKKQCKDENLSTKKELLFSLIGALLFLLLSLPLMYRGTNVIFSMMSLPTYDNGAPTVVGLIIHFVVYFGLTFGIMKLVQKIKK